MIPASEYHNARVKPALRAEFLRHQQAKIILKYFPNVGKVTREEIDEAARRKP